MYFVLDLIKPFSCSILPTKVPVSIVIKLVRKIYSNDIVVVLFKISMINPSLEFPKLPAYCGL